jgi:VIT1/CCC1 family predicted Fe2+/Mn2+ transporter
LFAFVTVFVGVGYYTGAIALILNVILSTLYLCYLVGLRPHESKRDGALEFISEMLLLYCFFGMMLAETIGIP